uniref:Thiamin pyrophosphokinase 1 n=1 Tax=Cacopsylla melanoneura TaxID=428564 RepID=A0A8D9AFG4_9HEMI
MLSSVRPLLSLHSVPSSLFSCLLVASYARFVHTNDKHMGSLLSTPHQKEETHWHPDRILHAVKSPGEDNFGIIILNRPITMNATILTNLWKKAKIRCTVDKGTDRWISYLSENKLNPAHFKPDIVTGDFDSINQDSIAKFETLGSEIVFTPEQTFTDFQKAVNEIGRRVKVDYIIAVAESNGRLDHSLSNINTLYMCKRLPIYMMSEKSMCWVLRASGGNHIIHLNNEFTTGKKVVGLIPVGSPVHNTYTTGLKWNLKNQMLSFGGLLSSSNTYEDEDAQSVSVRMSAGDLLWIMQTPSKE